MYSVNIDHGLGVRKKGGLDGPWLPDLELGLMGRWGVFDVIPFARPSLGLSGEEV